MCVFFMGYAHATQKEHRVLSRYDTQEEGDNAIHDGEGEEHGERLEEPYICPYCGHTMACRAALGEQW